MIWNDYQLRTSPASHQWLGQQHPVCDRTSLLQNFLKIKITRIDKLIKYPKENLDNAENIKARNDGICQLHILRKCLWGIISAEKNVVVQITKSIRKTLSWMVKYEALVCST